VALALNEMFFPVYPAERCVLNGKVTLVLKDVPLLYVLHFGVVIGNENIRDIIKAVPS
jgi:hypothetical protein